MHNDKQIPMFARGARIDSLYSLSDYKFSELVSKLDLSVLPESARSFIQKFVLSDEMLRASLKNKAVLDVYFNLILKYPSIKSNAEEVDFVVTYEHLKDKESERAVLASNILKDYLKNTIEPKQKEVVPSKPKVIKSINDFPEPLSSVMPLFQKQVVAEMKSDELAMVMADLNKQVMSVPALGATENLESNEKMVILHYFYAGSDWYIFEMGDGLFFGYTILNNDLDMAEYGYISIEELTNTNKIELDFYWTPRTLDQVLKTR